MRESYLTPYAYESITVSNTAGGIKLSSSKFTQSGIQACRALITAEVNEMRFTLDGTVPTSSVGHLLEPGQVLNLDNSDEIQQFCAISTGSTSGVLQVTYFRHILG